MTSGTARAAGDEFSVIVPVHNEAARLAETTTALLTGLPPGCEVIFVCNGCTDGSEALLRTLVGMRAHIISAPEGKAKAIRVGEAHASLLPRFYVDADVIIRGSDLAELSRHLEGPIELVSPRIAYDLEGARPAVRRIHRFWLSLPHGQQGAFHHVLGVSAAGRARWNAFPNLLADDAFIQSRFTPHNKQIVSDITVTVRPPRSMWSWIRVRARWHAGHKQMRAAGFSPPHARGQFSAISRQFFHSLQRTDAIIYVGSVLIARMVAAWPGQRWYQDRTSR